MRCLLARASDSLWDVYARFHAQSFGCACLLVQDDSLTGELVAYFCNVNVSYVNALVYRCDRGRSSSLSHQPALRDQPQEGVGGRVA